MTRYCTYKSYEEYMKQNCQSSCGFCSGGGQGIKNNDFDRYQPTIPTSAMGFSRKKIPPVEDEVTVHNKLCFIVNIHKNKFIFPEKIPNEILLIIIIYEFLYMIIRSK